MNYSDFDLNLIKTFCTVFECKSILAASEKLFVSQPAVTNSIKRFETYLNGKVFVRTPKGIIPTNEGIQLYSDFQTYLNGVDKTINKFKEKSAFEKGYLNIGSSSTIIRKLLLPFIKEFKIKYNNIVITITDADSEKLTLLAQNGNVDLCVLSTPINNENIFNVTKIKQIHDCFIANPNYDKNFLNKNEMAFAPLILQKNPSTNRKYFEKICSNNKIIYEPIFEIGSFGLITDFVSKEMGVAFTVEEFVLDDIKNGRVKKLDTDIKIDARDVCVITPITSVNSLICEKFIEEIKEYFKN